MYKIYSVLLVIAVFFAACNEKTVVYEDALYGDTYKTINFEIQSLTFEERPYYRTSPYSLNVPALADSNGIALHVRNDDTTYHPVVLAQYMIRYTNSYYLTQNQEYIDLADKYLNKLLEDAYYTVDSAPFFPYTFDFELHGDYSQIMKAPWFSAMAQGQALSAIVDLYEFTQDEKYRLIADKVYRTFKLRTTESEYWVAVADSKEYLWLEEYPMDSFNYTLNGTVFAIYGVFDYYRINQTDSVKTVLQASITAIHDNILKFRNPGSYSNYCIKHAVPSKEYHKIHVGQLQQLYKMTNEPYFNEVAELFIEDFYDY